jgi:high affinity Mn2+ porin
MKKLKIVKRTLLAFLLGCLLSPSAYPDDGSVYAKIRNAIGNADPDNESWSIHGQATEIVQGYPSFNAPYSGTNSLSPESQWKNSTTSTLFLGRRLWEGAEAYFDPEIYEGKGLSQTFGMAGFPNGEANKAGSWGFEYQAARAFVRQVIGLGGATEKIAAGQNQLATVEDVSRITVTSGKFAAADIFDNNSYTHDPRSQFLNWALMDGAAWDYPADARGYTRGAAIELNQTNWALRYGVFLEPKTPNSSDLAFHGINNLANIVELEERYTIHAQPGKAHFLVFLNRNREAYYTDAFSLGGDINAAIAGARQYGHNKYGFAVSAEQRLTDNIGAFTRLSMNDGQSEDFMFTQVDESAAAGLSVNGKPWGRSADTIGIAGIINGISSGQRKAVEEGYYGILIGDGILSYKPEMILEACYAFALTDYATLSPDYQLAVNPGYNAERGPVNIFAVRLHMQF